MTTTTKIREVLLRSADVGPTYLSWTWMTDPFISEVHRFEKGILDAVLGELDDALPASLVGENPEVAVLRALRTGALADRDREATLARRLADALLPGHLLAQILRYVTVGERVRIRLTPSPRLARVPWEILMTDDGRRLVELAEIRYDPPATVHARRSVRPKSWRQVCDRPALFVIDPLLAPSTPASQVLVSHSDRAPFVRRLEELRDAGHALWEDEEAVAPINGRVTRLELASALRTERSRLFYFGHVDSEPDTPGSAALLLSDEPAPLSALDILLGAEASSGSRAGAPASHGWKMPPRVAVIGCEGGADYRAIETFGLVIAMIDSGAELVSTTRWTMPTDAAFHAAYPTLAADVRPTTALALEVDRAHMTDDPVAELNRWQRAQLDEWRRHGSIGESPLVWASLTHTSAPAR